MAKNRKHVTVLLCRHWVQIRKDTTDTSIWGVNDPLDDAPGKQDACIAGVEKNLTHFNVVDWRSSPVLRARQSTERAAAIYGHPVAADAVKTEPALGSPDFDFENRIYAELKAAGVAHTSAKEAWRAFFDHSTDAAVLANKVAVEGAELVKSVALGLHDGEATALYTHHPIVSWIASGLNHDGDNMFNLDKGGILAVDFVIEDDKVVSFDFKEFKAPAPVAA